MGASRAGQGASSSGRTGEFVSQVRREGGRGSAASGPAFCQPVELPLRQLKTEALCGVPCMPACAG